MGPSIELTGLAPRAVDRRVVASTWQSLHEVVSTALPPMDVMVEPKQHGVRSDDARGRTLQRRVRTQHSESMMPTPVVDVQCAVDVA